MRVAVLGAGGAIGGHLVEALLDEGHDVVAVDVKPPDDWWQWHDEWHEDVHPYAGCDLSDPDAAAWVVDECDEVYNLACAMGGIGFISSERWACMRSTAINLAVLDACARSDRDVRVFYSSSACAYPTDRQGPQMFAPRLREDEAWQGRPELGYGEEKLYGEALCDTLNAEPRYGVTCRVARYHNVYGTHSTWEGGREKAPAAICRKVAEAKLSGSGVIDIWGDGTQRRSYLDVSDAVAGTLAVMRSDHPGPLNVGSDRDVSVDELVSIAEDAAGVKLERRYDLSAPQGVGARNADLTLVKQVTGWEPKVSLEDGVARLYRWVEAQVAAR